MNHKTQQTMAINLLGRANDVLFSIMIKIALVKWGRIERVEQLTEPVQIDLNFCLRTGFTACSRLDHDAKYTLAHMAVCRSSKAALPVPIADIIRYYGPNAGWINGYEPALLCTAPRFLLDSLFCQKQVIVTGGINALRAPNKANCLVALRSHSLPLLTYSNFGAVVR